MKTFENDLTTRQWDLYQYLKSQTDYKHIRDIMAESELYGEVPEMDLNNSSGARNLKKDIRALKRSGVIQTVILSCSAKGIKLATKKEYKIYSERKWKAIKSVIKLQVTQDNKAGLDNQIRLVFGNEKPIIEAFKEVAV